MNLNELVEACKTKVVPFMQEHRAITAAAASGAVIGGLLYIGGSVITNGVIAGGLMALGVGAILYKIQTSENIYLQWLHKQMCKHPIASDVAITALAFFLAPPGITAWVAATVAGLIATAYLFAIGGRHDRESDRESASLDHGQVVVPA